MHESSGALARYQADFATWLLAAEPPGGPLPVPDDPQLAVRQALGLQIHRNNVLYSLTEALRAQFPVVARLVGPAFFGALARDHVLAMPPREASLTLYGEQLDTFIRQSPACAQLPWLADVATLEWACQRALHAADEPVLQAAELLDLGGEQELAGAQLHLCRSATLLHSPYPVDRIWAENLNDEPAPLDLATANECWLLVYRSGEQVEVVTLAAATFALLQALQQGATLAQAWNRIPVKLAPALDEVPALLGYLLMLGVFTTCNLPEKDTNTCQT